MTTLTKADFEKFWIRCYLNSSSNFIDSVIDRAYLDFSRTLHGIGQTEDNRVNLKTEMKGIISELLTTSFENQYGFDKWHELKCNKLIEAFKRISKYELYVGQAQKWINMSFKYLFALGEIEVGGISKNYKYFHIPVDNIIQKKLLEEFKIPDIQTPWSRIKSYPEYLNYQVSVRNQINGMIPLDLEFKLYNQK